MLKIDQRDVVKDNDKNLRTRKKNINMNFGFIPTKSRITTNLKENKENEYRRSNAYMRWGAGTGIERKNLFNSGISGLTNRSIKNMSVKKEEEDEKNENDYNKNENEDDESNSGSIIDNDNDE